MASQSVDDKDDGDVDRGEGDVRAAAWSLRLMTSWWLIDSLLSGTLLIATATSLYYLQVVLFLLLIKWPSPQFDRVPFHCCDCVLLCSSIFYLIFFWMMEVLFGSFVYGIETNNDVSTHTQNVHFLLLLCVPAYSVSAFSLN